MSRYLRQNTAIRITVGPFLDKTDGITPEVALTATNEHLTLMVDDNNVPTLVLDADATASGGSNDLVHVTNDDAGFYDLELTAAQLNYVGRAMLSINYATDHCPVFHEFTILPAQVYDSLVLGTDLLDANASQLGGTSQTGRDVGASVLISSGTGAGQLDVTSGVIKANLVQILATALTETAGQIAAAFRQFFNVGSPTGTVNEVTAIKNDIQSRLPAALSGDGFIKADLLSIGDELVSGNNATLNLKKLDIRNTVGNAVKIYAADNTAVQVSAQTVTPGQDFISAILFEVLGSANNWAVDVYGADGAIGMEIAAEGKAVNIKSTTATGMEISSETGNNDAVSLISSGTGKSINAPQDIAVSDGDLTLANINAQVVDVLTVDTFPQPGQEAPAATQTLKGMLAYLYKAFRNKITQTATTMSLFADDASTVDQKATTSDDGSTYTRGEIGSGP